MASAPLASSSAAPTAFEDAAALGTTKELETTMGESLSLIDRFYAGGNRAHAEALSLLVVVLDSVVQRMRQGYATRKAAAAAIEAECASIDAQVAALRKLQAPLADELAEKRSASARLEKAIQNGNEVIGGSVAAAREALAKAQLAQRSVNSSFAAGMKLNSNGFDGKGRPLPGREVNLRKNPNGPAARKPGDMLRDVQPK
ncbi:hypothetical protein AB1Y20_021865 [Prymnesium parvum]|uniref:Mediator of RNA polymerase II transcription subunit 4 n=1 Tax=Prymnesium parvum TaxID=97485 RepID=A0AB34JKL8_PRYPA